MRDVALGLVLAFVLLAVVFGAGIKVAAWNQCRAIGGPLAHCWEVVQR